MCGIAGCLAVEKSVSIDPTLTKTMTDAIAHRGPDGQGHWLKDDHTIALGHRRLSIIDLSQAGHQPMHFQNRYVIVFNGEIYNYVELRERCIKQGYQFESHTDTEVIMALYDWVGVKCLDEMDGMFAFAIWDEVQHELFVARDRFGEKPFYYAFDKGLFVFASEMKALWAGGVAKNVDQVMLYNYLVNGLIDNPIDKSGTYYANIRKLPAAHYALVKPNESSVKPVRYWDINTKDRIKNITNEEAKSRFRELMFTSVERRLRSDVPIGSSLSGGLDSSVLVCTIDSLNADSLFAQKTFSARFPGYKKDESRYQQMVIDRCKAQPFFVEPTAQSMLAELKHVVYHHEEPFQHASMVAQYEVYKLAKDNGVTVLLDGQGADEVAAGYHYYYQAYFNGLKTNNPQKYKAERAAYYSLMADNSINVQHKRDWRWAMKQMVPASIYESLVMLKRKTVGSQSHLRKNFVAGFGHGYTRKSEFENLQQALYYESMCSGLENLLRYADRNSMAHSREVRLPFLSHELVEFLFSLPDDFKIREGWTKWLVRTAFEDLLPQEITWRKDKIGYEPPQDQWMLEPAFKEQVRLSAECLADEQILDKANTASFDAFFQWKVFMAAQSLFMN